MKVNFRVRPAAPGDAPKSLEIDAHETIDNVKALLEVELGIPMQNQMLLFMNRELVNTSTLAKNGLLSNDVVYVVDTRRMAPSVQPAPPPPSNLDQLFSPMSFDPFDLEAQRKLEEEIKLKNVLENMSNAFEHSPESFARVFMLYIDCKVNGFPAKAFVDSGAQVTIMSRSLAEQCNVLRLLDTRFAGQAKGVGTGTILGRVHLAPIEIGGEVFNCSFSIMDDAHMDLLFGLDMLKRHQCCIDLRNNQLSIGSAGHSVPFLSEKDLPEHAKLTYESPSLEASKNPANPTPIPAPSTSSSAPSTGHRLGSAGPPSTFTAPQQRQQLQQQQQQPQHVPQPLPTLVPAPQTPQQAPQPQQIFVSEEVVSQLVSMGFPRQQVLLALQQTNGNPDLAASLLFGGF